MSELTGKGFEFRDSDHRYFYDGKAMVGCTTILGVIAKPALIQWAANMTSEYAKDECVKLFKKYDGVVPLDYIEEILNKARFAHIKKKEKAADKGIDIHEEIEWLIKHFIDTNEGYFPKIFSHTDVQVENFDDWSYKNKVKFIESEKMVYSKKHMVAGTMDFKCIINDKIYIGDIKTSSRIYDRTAFAQCAGYQMMDGDKDVKGRVVVNLKKTGKFDEGEDVYYSHNYKRDLGIFMAALNIYRNIKW